MKRNGRWIKKTYIFSHGKTNFFRVATGYIGSKKVDILDNKIDKNERILISDVKVNETNFVLVNICNANTKTEQVAILHELDKTYYRFNY